MSVDNEEPPACVCPSVVTPSGGWPYMYGTNMTCVFGSLLYVVSPNGVVE